MEELGSHQGIDDATDEPLPAQAPEGGDDGQSVRIGASGHEGPGLEALGTAARPWEGLESREVAVGAAEAPLPKINPS